jgi:hypothetical protein
MAKGAGLVHYVSLLWAATVLSVLLIASKTNVRPKVVLFQNEGGKLDWGKPKETGKWTKEGLLAGSKMWGTASEAKPNSRSVLSTSRARESISDFFDHLEVVIFHINDGQPSSRREAAHRGMV